MRLESRIVLFALALMPVATAHAQRTDNPHGEKIGSCATCHAPDSWRPVRISKEFKHAERTFPLDGAHLRTACTACHKSLVFDKVTNTCASCHNDVHHGELGTECARCHTTRSFVDQGQLRRMHELTRFPLRGAHSAARCDACHAPATSGRPQYTGRSTSCFSCHDADYRRATPDHVASSFSQDCTSCHGNSTWLNARFDHSVTRFPLSGAHSAVSCNSCHADRVFRGKNMECVSCHQADYDRSVNPPHAGFPTTCATCHTVNSWKGATFDHNTTQFPLVGAHVQQTCASCHGDGVYRGKPTTCISCHQRQFDSAIPPHAPSGFSTVCGDCHTSMTTWKGGTINHQIFPFPLTGAHLTVSCVDCHGDNVFKGKSAVCAACHQNRYAATTNPPHAAAGFATTCESCHTTASWLTATFDHSTTRFALQGAHAAASCAACHGDGVYRGKPMTCISCHQKDYDAGIPPHGPSGFSNVCTDCHTSMATWKGAPFNHQIFPFPLTGAHLTLSCADCHGDNVFKGKSAVCAACHQNRYAATTNPPHAAAGFATTCESCHTTSSWLTATFDHNSTRFPLQGAHAAASCASCHGDGVYRGKPMTCISCHQKDYDAAVPPHGASGFSTVCTDCHTSMTAWKGAPFNHQIFPFPLTGAHLALSCVDCHADNIFKGKSTVCAACHQNRYAATTNPPHAAAGFPATCESCHTTASWLTATFDHNATRFPLQGAHAAASCASCHGDGVYAAKPTTCISCHQRDYDGAIPPHAASGFSQVCTDCHTSLTTWQGAAFNHQIFPFPLTGAHLAVACSGCHSDNVYKGKPTTCVSCHQNRYTATTNPPHAAAGFPTTCETCHTTSSWLTATFDHNATRFPLTGAHATVSCTSCHGDGVYRGKTMVCSGCHLAQYTATTNPNHAAASFPTTCESCHTTTTWQGATFNHDANWFPIYSGSHRGRWSTCADCHTSPTNFALFSCFQCHLKPQTDSQHQGRSGYSYDSAKCYACHPRGSSD